MLCNSLFNTGIVHENNKNRGGEHEHSVSLDPHKVSRALAQFCWRYAEDSEEHITGFYHPPPWISSVAGSFKLMKHFASCVDKNVTSPRENLQQLSDCFEAMYKLWADRYPPHGKSKHMFGMPYELCMLTSPQFVESLRSEFQRAPMAEGPGPQPEPSSSSEPATATETKTAYQQPTCVDEEEEEKVHPNTTTTTPTTTTNHPGNAVPEKKTWLASMSSLYDATARILAGLDQDPLLSLTERDSMRQHYLEYLDRRLQALAKAAVAEAKAEAEAEKRSSQP